jgi:hypothetical protein
MLSILAQFQQPGDMSYDSSYRKQRIETSRPGDKSVPGIVLRLFWLDTVNMVADALLQRGNDRPPPNSRVGCIMRFDVVVL